jgi:hypothetical protein
MLRRHALAILASGAIGGADLLQGNSGKLQEHQSCKGHVAWVSEVLQRILTMKPGMTREGLLGLFTTEGGISTALQRTYVSRDCPYFKVDVTFRAVGRPDRDENGRGTVIEGNEDIILTLSRPYLQFSVMD